MRRPGKTTQDQKKRVALCLTGLGAYAQNVLIGVLEYIRETRCWDARFVGPLGGDTGKLAPNWGHWKADGALLQLDTLNRIEIARRLDMPVVNIYDSFKPEGLPSVICNNYEAGRLVARHFLERGFRHFGFVDNSRYYSRLRCEGFAQELDRNGISCDTLHHGVLKMQWEIDRERAGEWIRRQPKPVAVMTCSDLFGVHLVNLCNEIGLHVPDDVGIVGVDNDEAMSTVCSQPLSSVAMPSRRVGYRAAALLDRLMRGKRPPRSPILLEPTGVVARQSSDAIGVADDDIRSAMRFIRHHAGTPIGVSDLLKEVPVCRTILDRKFRVMLGYSPAKAILRSRVELAKQLLSETNLKAEDVARRSGFTEYSTFYRVFQRHTGLAPDSFRGKARQI